MHFSPEVVSEHTDGTSVFIEKVEFAFNVVVVVDHVGHRVLSEVDRGFRVSVVDSVQFFSLDVFVQVVSNNVDLVESSPESFGGGNIVHISDTENIGVFLMLKSFMIDIEHVVGFGSS